MADTYPSGLAQARQRLAESQKDSPRPRLSIPDPPAPLIDLAAEPEPERPAAVATTDDEVRAVLAENQALRAENERLRQALRQARDVTARALED